MPLARFEPVDSTHNDEVDNYLLAHLGGPPEPERGFYGWAAGRLQSLTATSLADLRDQGLRLVLGIVDLSAHRDSPLSPGLLDQLAQAFGLLRDSGVKAVLRPVYNYDSRGADAGIARVRSHVEQLAPVLADNADAIGYVQAGYVGAWGEWHDSQSGLTSVANKLAVRDAVLAGVPPQFAVQFRYPYDLIKWFPRALESGRAFDGSAQSRLGVHNDCFLSSDNDVGTYTINSLTRNSQRAYTRAITEFTPFGGETCRGFGPMRQHCSDILSEGAAYHLAYLNIAFYKAFIQRWKVEGCYEQVARSMGYRLQLDEMTHAVGAPAGSLLGFTVALRNVGWSRVFSPRRLVVTLVHRSTGAAFSGIGGTDLRHLPSQAGTSNVVDVDVALPDGAPAGAYDIAISLPDVYRRTAGDVRQFIRFANADDPAAGQAWNASTGRFDTGALVHVH